MAELFPEKDEKALTPPEQNRRNWLTVQRLFTGIFGALTLVGQNLFHPERLWRELTTSKAPT